MYEEARRIHEALGDRWGLSYTLRYLAVVLWMEADYTAARPVIDASLSLAREIGDSQGVGLSLTVTSYVACSLGEHKAAETAARNALRSTNGTATGGAQRRRCGRSEWRSPDRVATREANAHHKRALVDLLRDRRPLLHGCVLHRAGAGSPGRRSATRCGMPTSCRLRDDDGYGRAAMAMAQYQAVHPADSGPGSRRA